MRKPLSLLFVLAIAAGSGGATDCGQAIDDRGFDVWCGDTLCRWRVEKGDVARAATWHDGDSGVSLVGAEAAISQLTSLETEDGHCVKFSLVADVSEDAEVRLQMDVFGDGSNELDERIPTSDWSLLTYRVRMPDSYQGVRFRLVKRGGDAVLANIGAEMIDDALCTGPALVVGRERPFGLDCATDDDCASGLCGAGGTCDGCDLEAGCGGGEVCGLSPIVEVHQHPYLVCRAPGSAATGTSCLGDAECASGRCVGFVCGACDDDAQCGPGGSCEAVAYTVDYGGDSPTTIRGGGHCVGGSGGAAPAGAACLVDGDCASGTCGGEPLNACWNNFGNLRECRDDMDCSPNFGPYQSCVTVGIRGGTCQ